VRWLDNRDRRTAHRRFGVDGYHCAMDWYENLTAGMIAVGGRIVCGVARMKGRATKWSRHSQFCGGDLYNFAEESVHLIV
jgi:hypothetical protein